MYLKKTETKSMQDNAGAMIRYAASQKGMSISEVARAMGVSKSMVCLWLNGRRPIPSTRLDSLLRIVGLEIDEVL